MEFTNYFRSALRFVLAFAVVAAAPCIATARTVTFDDLELPADSAWVGPDQNGRDVDGDFGTTVRVGQFVSNDVRFANEFNLNWESWSGMAYSNKTDNTTAGFLNDRSAITGSGSGDAIYGLGFGYRDSLDPQDVSQIETLPGFELPVGERPVSIEVTNTTYAALSMRNGDDFAKKFGGSTGLDADHFRLSVYGVGADGQLTGQTEIYLADFRADGTEHDFILDEWALFDLTPLGDAQRLYFNLDSSDVGQFGMNTPSYFAFDNIRTVPEPAAGFGLGLAFAWLLIFATRRHR